MNVSIISALLYKMRIFSILTCKLDSSTSSLLTQYYILRICTYTRPKSYLTLPRYIDRPKSRNQFIKVVTRPYWQDLMQFENHCILIKSYCAALVSFGGIAVVIVLHFGLPTMVKSPCTFILRGFVWQKPNPSMLLCALMGPKVVSLSVIYND